MQAGESARRLCLSSLTGRQVHGPEHARRIGRLRDVVVDLSLTPAQVTKLVVGDRRGSWSVPWRKVSLVPPEALRVPSGARPQSDEPVILTPHELGLVRDVLDARVYDVPRRRSARVGDVWFDQSPDASLTVAGLEVGSAAFLRRLGLPRLRSAPSRLLPMSEFDLPSTNGHRVRLATPSSSVHALEGPDLARLLTHIPMASAAEVVQHLPAPSVSQAVDHLHPHLADRLQRALHR